jgi:putative SOS response-associated peptidase YedK
MLSAKDADQHSLMWKNYNNLDPKIKKSIPLKMMSEDNKIFSNYFTNIIVEENDSRIIKPMRYRVRPQGAVAEIPNKYNVFNARLDALESRQTWSNLFMKKHGLVPLTGFYEWVLGPNNKSELIKFAPKEKEMMWAPVLYDEWISPDKKIAFKSFAIITHEPPSEILKMGHDRCPIFLNKEFIDIWLNPKRASKEEIYSILQKKEDAYFDYSWV